MAREKLSKKDLMTVFWRSFAIMGSMNYERMQGLGYAWSLFPCLKKIYKDNKTCLLYTSKAAPEVVAKKRERAAELTETIAAVKAQLADFE